MSPSAPATHIFQIYYSEATRKQLDPGFEPLDNTGNERPDWREYWPIRRHLLNHQLIPGDYYGFLSPAFKAKTGLSAEVVIDFVNAQRGVPDVMLFSPYYDQIAFFLNQWEQGTMSHKNSKVFEQSLPLVAPEFGLRSTTSSSRDSVFCNYFVARSEFWLEWLGRCERLFECAERGESALGRALREDVDYKSDRTPAKVFIIERVASAMLATQPRWIAKAYNPMLLPFSRSPVSGLGPELAALDALKIAHRVEPLPQYLRAFFELRARYAAQANKK
jgi:hypothetical protein